jgi:hypothetical protein
MTQNNEAKELKRSFDISVSSNSYLSHIALVNLL